MSRRNSRIDVFQFVDMKGGEPDVCWPWKRKLKHGRPYFRVDGRERPAYVVVLELHTGEEANGRMARHNCDRPDCCNPHHLRWGSHQDNMDDMKERERHGLSTITVRSIKNLLDGNDFTHSAIATQFGVSRETVTAINNERTSRSRVSQRDGDENGNGEGADTRVVGDEEDNHSSGQE